MSILPRFDGTAIKNFIFPSGWGFPDSLRLPLSLCELRRTGPPKRAGFGGASSAGVEQEITEITERKPADLEGRCLQAADFQVLPLFKSERRRGKGQRNDGQGNGGQRVMGWFGFGDVFSGTRRARGGGFRACCSADF